MVKERGKDIHSQLNTDLLNHLLVAIKQINGAPGNSKKGKNKKDMKEKFFTAHTQVQCIIKEWTAFVAFNKIGHTNVQ